RPTNPFDKFQKEDIEQPICTRFEEQVRKYPTNLAIKTGTYEWSYEQLNRVSNNIARSIMQLQGAGGDQIALLLEHDAPMVAAFLGTLKAGKTYVPLDPQYPKERLSYIVQDSQAQVVLTNKRFASLAQELCGGDVTHIDIDELDLESPASNPNLSIS